MGLGKRGAMTRIRYGSASTVFSTTWIKFLAPGGQRRVITLLGREQGITATVTISGGSSDVREFDVLVDADGRRYQVIQVINKTVNVQAQVVEVPRFIADEFENQFIEEFWSQSGSGWSESDIPGMLSLDPPVASFPAAASRLVQTIPAGEDFDVWARIIIPFSSPSSQQMYALLGARISTTQGVYVGITNSGNDGVLRLDQTGASAMDDWVAHSGGDAFVRLKRVQGTFHTYFKANPGLSSVKLEGTEPASDEDWIEIVPANGGQLASGVAATGAVEVGLFGFELIDGGGDHARIIFVRNW